MDRGLMEAAQAGNLNALYASIGSNPKILDSVDETTFANTPLHAAASAGHTNFAIEIMILKPSFGKKLNQEGLSPLHLALQNSHFETAKRLVKFDSELIRVKGKEGCTPLHCVAKTDNVDLMVEFLCACPESVKDLTSRDETALHIAVEENNRKAFEVLLGWLRRTHNKEVIHWRDEKGNTVLHVAVSTNQPQIVKLIVEKAGRIKNVKNENQSTALDITCSTEVRNILEGVNAKSASSLSKDDNLAEYLTSPARVDEVVLRYILKCRRKLTMDMSNMLLVVAVLIATATYQAVLSPPAAFSFEKQNTTNGSHAAATHGSPHYTSGVGKGYMVGFYWLNTIAFNASIAVMTLIIRLQSSSYLLVHFSLFFVVASYGFSLYMLSRLDLIDWYLMALSYFFSCWAYFVSVYVWYSETELELETYARLIRDYIVGLPKRWRQRGPGECLQKHWMEIFRSFQISSIGRRRLLHHLEKFCS